MQVDKTAMLHALAKGHGKGFVTLGFAGLCSNRSDDVALPAAAEASAELKQNRGTDEDLPINRSSCSESSRDTAIPVSTVDDAEGIIPLIPEERSEPYPLDALPPMIQDAVRCYHAYGQQPLPLVACAALANASLACQGLVDVARDDVLSGPISLSFLIAADSGERKTSADKVFSAAARSVEAEKMQKGLAELKAFNRTSKQHDLQRQHLEKQLLAAGGDFFAPDARTRALQEKLQFLEDNAPKRPVVPQLFYEDITQEAMAEQLAQGWKSAALYSDEAAIVIGSHGFSEERALRYFGFLNRLWDGNSYRSQRKTTASVHLEGCRLSCSLMMQPSVLQQLLRGSNQQSRGTGFLARMLCTWPQTTMGRRLYKEPQNVDTAIAPFASRIRELLTQPLPLKDESEGTGLLPPALPLSVDAHRLWIAYYNETEEAIAPFGSFADVRDFAAKSAENAARLAAVFHIFVGDQKDSIPCATMASAIRIARWHLQETRRIFGQLAIPDDVHTAQKLLDWLLTRKQPTITPRQIAQYGPNSLRHDKRNRETVLLKLCEHRYLGVEKTGKRTVYHLHPSLLEAGV